MSGNIPTTRRPSPLNNREACGSGINSSTATENVPRSLGHEVTAYVCVCALFLSIRVYLVSRSRFEFQVIFLYREVCVVEVSCPSSSARRSLYVKRARHNPINSPRGSCRCVQTHFENKASRVRELRSNSIIDVTKPTAAPAARAANRAQSRGRLREKSRNIRCTQIARRAHSRVADVEPQRCNSATRN